MFSVLVNNLSTLIVTVRRNVLSSLLTTLLILALIVSWSARDVISAYLTGNVVQEQQRVNAERDRMIQRRLKAVLDKTGAARVVIREFSVEKSGEGETPFVTTTHWVVAPGISEPPASLQHTPRAMLGHMIDPLFNGQCTTGTLGDIADPVLRQTVQQQTGSIYWYMCPLIDLDGKPIGYIAVSYISYGTAHPPEDALLEYMRAQALILSGYIDNRTSPDPWYQQYL